MCLGWEQLIYFIRAFVAAHGLSHKSHMVGVIPQWPEEWGAHEERQIFHEDSCCPCCT